MTIAAVEAVSSGCRMPAEQPPSPTVATVSVEPQSTTIPLFGSLQFKATLRDARGERLTGQITWTSSDTSVASVSATGLVSAKSVGGTAITATIDGVSGVGALTVAFLLSSIASGSFATCGVTPSGTALCWGNNNHGNLGDGTVLNRYSPTLLAGGRQFSVVIPAQGRSCGLSSGAAYCWGFNGNGLLGDGTTENRLTPTAVAGSYVFVDLTANEQHTCGLVASGAAYCWGTNTHGQLGDGTTVRRMTPVAVIGGHSFTRITAGYDHTCGLASSGAAYCWGNNSSGQIGDGTMMLRLSPTPSAIGWSLSSISAGNSLTCGVTSMGAGVCWGANNGRFGDGTYVSRSVPVQVSGGLSFTQIAVGLSHNCGITGAGAAYCWGNGTSGSLGDGSFSSNTRLEPVAVVGGLAFSTVASGAHQTCALTAEGVPYCWGYSGVGDGTSLSHAVPVRIRYP